MTTDTEGRQPHDEAVDQRLRTAGTRLHEHVAAHVDVDRRLDELASAQPRRHRWVPLGAAATAAVAAVVAGVVLTAPPRVVVDAPEPDVAGEPGTPDATTDDQPPARPCAADGLAASEPADAAVPTAVASTREQILTAARACDVERLAALAGVDFTFSFGGGDDPAAYWRQLEEEGEAPLATLVGLLSLPAAADPDASPSIWSWPRAYTSPESAHLEELERRFGEEALDEWVGPDGQYYGPRVGIREDGTWLFYVAGD